MPDDPREPRVSALKLFLTFPRVTLASFGGALFWSRRALVEQHGWLTEQEFVEMVSLTPLIAKLYERHPKAVFAIAIRRGLAPITIGLVFSSAWALLPAVNADWGGYALTALTVVVLVRTKLNPLWLFVIGALAGLGGVPS